MNARTDSRLEKKLSAFAAAGAASAGLAALAQPAEAHVVYTAANVTIQDGVGSIPIDLNGDGIVDFTIEFADGPKSLFVDIIDAAAIFFGGPIGPDGAFVTGEDILLASCAAKSNFSGCGGPWDNIGTRYLGVEFQIAGQTHFGWVRINMVGVGGTITGYAYESTPNTAIAAGHLHPGVKTAELAPTTPVQPSAGLGALALGVQGFSLWRKDEMTQ